MDNHECSAPLSGLCTCRSHVTGVMLVTPRYRCDVGYSMLQVSAKGVC